MKDKAQLIRSRLYKKNLIENKQLLQDETIHNFFKQLRIC